MAGIGAVVSVGSADTIINAFVQQFGATPHTVITTPNNTRNVQIDWNFTSDFNQIQACNLTFDRILPNDIIVICKLSGHDANNTDNQITNNTPGPIVGFGQVTPTGASQTINVPVKCDPGAHLRPQVVSGNFTTVCDVQDIDDVKVILIGESTCSIIDPTSPPSSCATTTTTTTTTTITTTTTAPHAPTTQIIEIFDNGFSDFVPDATPGDNDTSVAAGTIVNWTYITGASVHNVNSGSCVGVICTPDGNFSSPPTMLPGDSYTLNTATLAAGDYKYFCSIHGAAMVGTLRVT